MTSTVGSVERLAEELLERTARVAQLADARAAVLAAADGLPADLVEASLAAGLYRLGLPKELGGLGVALPTVVSVIEQLAHADGSVGWCTAVANAGAKLLGGVDEAEARVIAADPERLCIAGGFAPLGRARRVDGGLELTGSWGFASGCTAATWFLGGAMVDPSDPPRPVVTFFPADEGRILPDWDVIGLRATGSHTITATGVVVPAGRTASLLGGPRWSQDPVTAIPFFAFGSVLAAVPLGMARRAMEELAGIAATRTPFGRHGTIATDPTFQQRFGTMLARLGAARVHLLDQANELWQHALDGAVPPLAEAGMALAVGVAGDTALEVVQFAHRMAGTTAIRSDGVLTRCLHDTMVATRHVAFAGATREGAARTVLGLARC